MKKAEIITNGNTNINQVKLDGKPPLPDNMRLDALNSICNDVNNLIFSYKLVHKYKSLFCSYYEEKHNLGNTIRQPKIECHFILGTKALVFFYVNEQFTKQYLISDLITLCSSWGNLGTWYKNYNEQTANGTLYDE